MEDQPDPGPTEIKVKIQSSTKAIYEESVQIGRLKVRIEFIGHALDRITARGIKIEEVMRCLKYPDARNLATDGGRKRIRRCDADNASRAVDVVYEEIDPTTMRVITAFRCSTRS